MTRSLNIGIVCFPSLGGSGVVATAQAIGLAQRGHRVHLIARTPPGRPLPMQEGLSFHPVRLTDYPLFDAPPYTLALASTLIDLSRAHALDVIHVHYAVPHAASAYLARQALGAAAPRIVTSLHGTDVTRVGIDPAYRSATLFTVAQSDGLIVPSRFLEQEALRLMEVPASLPIDVIPNFVDTDRFSPGSDTPSREPVLFHVSNFRPVKRVMDVLEVLARVRQVMPARLVMVGDGPELPLAQERANALEIAPWVRFTGKLNEFVDELRQADAFLLPSESESFGVVALEAMSTGVPVFGYRVGGLPELVTEDVGRLVTPRDVGALATAVSSVLQSPETLSALRRNARTRALTHYRAAPALDRYEAFLQRVLLRRRDHDVPHGSETP